MSFDPTDVSNAESIIVANLIIDEYSRPEILSRVDTQHFENEKCRYLYRLIKEMNDEQVLIDLYTLQTKIKSLNEYEDIGALINFMNDIVSNIAIVDNINIYVTLVINNATKRSLDKYINNWITDPDYDMFDPNSSFEKLQVNVDSIINSRNLNNVSLISEYVENFKDKLEIIKNNSGKITGTTSGFGEIDEITNGFQPGDLIILAARPSLGKTALAINFLSNALKKIDKNSNDCVVMFSLEMGTEQIMERMICSECRIKNSIFRSGKWNSDEEMIIHSKIEEMSKLNFFIDDTPSIKILDIQAKLLQISKKYNIKLVVVDYLQLIESNTKGFNRSVEVGIISRKLKIMARELNIPIIAIAQLSRKIEDRKEADRKPMLSDLRESGSIEQDADIVSFLDYQRDQIDENTKGKLPNGGVLYKDFVKVNFYIEKNRNGRTGMVTLGFDKSTGKYNSININKG